MGHKNQTLERFPHTTLLSVASIILILTMIATLAHSAEVEIQWKSVPEADGYNVYYGTESQTYQAPDRIPDPSQTTHKLTLDPGIYYFAITAFNQYGESSFSTEVSATIPEPVGVSTYTITASAGANGSISPSGAVSVNEGTDQGFTISPSSGYKVLDVLVDGASVGAVSTCSFRSVDANHTIEAVFERADITYSVTASADANGSISPSGTVSVSQGADQAFTFSPNSGYEVFDVRVDGVSVGAVSSYSFSGVNANHLIEVSFSRTENEEAGSEPARSPVPDIKANGQDGPVYLSYGENLLISIDLDPGTDYDRQRVDWWITCLSPDNAWYSYIWAKKWMNRKFVSGIYSTNRKGFRLKPISSYPVFSSSNLPPGAYTFYFAVDNNKDQKPDSTWSDSVEVHIQ
jgi:hypothetical protein